MLGWYANKLTVAGAPGEVAYLRKTHPKYLPEQVTEEPVPAAGPSTG